MGDGEVVTAGRVQTQVRTAASRFGRDAPQPSQGARNGYASAIKHRQPISQGEL